MKIERICKICGKHFMAIKATQFFCCRKCFKKDYYIRNRVRILEQKQKPVFPNKKCSFCHQTFKLDFDPMESPLLFNTWRCPNCGVPNDIIWKNHDNTNSRQVISNFLFSFSAQITMNSEPRFYPYRLPVTLPEQANPMYIVMTCEELNILNVGRGNRKKITFS